MSTLMHDPRPSGRLGALGLAGAALLVGAATLMAGCGAGDDSSTSATIGPVQSGTIEVSTVDNNFKPQDLTVTEGSTVNWVNDGRNDHNIITVEGKGWDGEQTPFKPGATYSHTFDKTGTFRYYCSLHGTVDKGMYGTVQVVKAP